MQFTRRFLLWVLVALAVGFLAGLLAQSSGWITPVEVRAREAAAQIMRQARQWQDRQ